MNIEIIREEKQKLQENLLKSLNEFNKTTGEVAEVSIIRVTHSTKCAELFLRYEVDVKIQL